MNRKIINEAKGLGDKLEMHAEYLQSNAEIGFELYKTVAYVKEQLTKIGLEPKPCGKCGIIADIKGKEKGKSFLLRADMDALKGVDSAEPERCVHACGHHYHTAMLLGAAELLENVKNELCGNVRLMFQPAEEILSGAEDMIQNRALENPRPDGAMMLHVMTAVDLPMGAIIVSNGGVSAPSAHFFEIEVVGLGTHGAMPHKGIDAISAAAYIITALNEIKARELPMGEAAAITIGKIEGGKSANVLPDRVVMHGSLRAMDSDVAENIKKRICEISDYTAKAMRASAQVKFTHGCPPLLNDESLSQLMYNALTSAFGQGLVMLSGASGELKMSGGSEDFSYVSQRVPSIIISLCAGSRADGYEYPLHNPKVRFDPRALPIGAAAYAIAAVNRLKNR